MSAAQSVTHTHAHIHAHTHIHTHTLTHTLALTLPDPPKHIGFTLGAASAGFRSPSIEQPTIDQTHSKTGGLTGNPRTRRSSTLNKLESTTGPSGVADSIDRERDRALRINSYREPRMRRGMSFSALRPTTSSSQRRLFSHTSVHLNPPSPEIMTPPSIKYNRPVGGIRAGILGFLTGLTVTGSYAYLHLFEEYQNACNVLLLSVEELKASTLKITNQVKRIEQVEKDLKRIESTSITDGQISKLKSELRKLIDQVQVEQLQLKSNLTTLETDLVSGKTSSLKTLNDGRMC